MLAEIVSQEAVSPAARVSAAGIVLDRGWGRAPQPHTGENDNEIRVTIRNFVGAAIRIDADAAVQWRRRDQAGAYLVC